MGVESLQIFIENSTTVYSGQRLSGLCVVTCSELTEIPKLIIILKGSVKISWEDRYEEHKNKVDLIEMQRDVAIQGGTLSQGTHRIPFDFQLPPGLASSFDSPPERWPLRIIGDISYWLEVTAPERSHSKTPASAGASVMILESIDTRLPRYQYPVGGSNTKNMCCCCCKSGPLAIEANLDRAAYSPHQLIRVTASFENNSNFTASSYVKLKQSCRVTSSQNFRVLTRYWELKPVTSAVQNVARRSSVKWEEIGFEIPECAATVTCPILENSYSIVIGMNILLMDEDLRVKLPITIGTIPFTWQTGLLARQPPATPPPSSQITAPLFGAGHSQGEPSPGLGISRRESMPPSYYESFHDLSANDF